MKNILLSLCFLAIAVAQVSAQKSLSAGVQHYGRHFAPALGNILNRAGFDLGDSELPQTKINSLRLDSTKTFVGYDLTGGLDSFPVSRTTYWYPQTGVRMEIEDQYDGSEWNHAYRNTFFYDELDRLVEVVAQYYDPEAGFYVPESRLEIFPRGTSPDLIDSFFVYGWNPEIDDYERIVSNINLFDNDDRLIEILSSFDFFGEQIVIRDVLYYDENDDNVLIESFTVLEGFEFLARKTEMEYINHLLIESIESSFTGAGFEPMSRITYAYTNTGALMQQSSFERDFEMGEWILAERQIYDYDDAGRLSAEETESYAEEGFTFDRVTYDYIQGTDLALETTYFRENVVDEWILDSKTYFYYNTLTSVPEAPRTPLALQVAPNPTTGTLQVRLENDALVQVFDATGLLRRSISFQPGQTIDLDGLPAGVYYLTAKDRNNVYSNKVVKL